MGPYFKPNLFSSLCLCIKIAKNGELTQALVFFLLFEYALLSNKHHTFTENNLISAAVLIWVFTNNRPNFVMALDIKRYENQVAWPIRPQPTRELLSF